MLRADAGERAYYGRLNKEFEKYDAVLYEIVTPEGNKPPKGGEKKSDNPVAMLEQGMKLFLRLEHQLEVVDYQKANFIHADLSPEGMKKAMKERGDDQINIMFGVSDRDGMATEALPDLRTSEVTADLALVRRRSAAQVSLPPLLQLPGTGAGRLC